MALLKTLRTLAGYLVVGWLTINSDLLWFFVATGAGCFFRMNYCFRVWYQLDVLFCSICHGTRLRSISGWTGQHMRGKRRYKLQAWVIDKLAELCGDEPQHCARTWEWEQRRGLTRP